MKTNYKLQSSQSYSYQQKDLSSQQPQQDEDETNNPLMNSISSSLSQYKIKQPLGTGAGSFVIWIEDYKTSEQFALKCILKQSSHYQNNAHRITNEFKLHSQLNHPNIVRMYKFFEDQEYVYMKMEFCAGGNLYDYLKTKGKLTEDETRKMSYQIILGLEYLHSNKVIHRDLKPGNVVLSSTNQVKICDFGLAVRLEDYASELQTFCGTPNYIAPEICSREPYGIKSDCWSFGCVLYTMATGRPPFDGLSVQEALKTLQNKNKNKINIPSSFSAELADLIEHTLDWNTESRYSIHQIKNHPFYASQISSGIIKSTDNVSHRRTNSNLSGDIKLDKENIHPNIINKFSSNSSSYSQSRNKPDRGLCLNELSKQDDTQKHNGFIQNSRVQHINNMYPRAQTTKNNNDNNGFKQPVPSIITSTPSAAPTVLSTLLSRSTKSSKSTSFHQSNNNNSQSFQSSNATGNKFLQQPQNLPSNRQHQKHKSVDLSQGTNYEKQTKLIDQSQGELQGQQYYQLKSQIPSEDLDKEWTLDPKTKKITSFLGNSQLVSQPKRVQTQQNIINYQEQQQQLMIQKKQEQTREYSNQQQPTMRTPRNSNNDFSNQNSSTYSNPKTNGQYSTNINSSSINDSKINYDNTKKYYQISSKSSQNNQPQGITQSLNCSIASPSYGTMGTTKNSNGINNNNSSYSNHAATSTGFFPQNQPNQQDGRSSSSNRNSNGILNQQKVPTERASSSQLRLDTSLQLSSYQSGTSRNSHQHQQDLSNRSSSRNFTPKESAGTIPAPAAAQSSRFPLPPPPSSVTNRTSSTFRAEYNQNGNNINPTPSSNNTSLFLSKQSSREYSKTEPNENISRQNPPKTTEYQEVTGSNRTNSNQNRENSIGLGQSKSFGFFGGDQPEKKPYFTQNHPQNILPSPVKVDDDLDVSKIQTRNGIIEITEDRSLLVESHNGKLLFEISQDGKKMQITKLVGKPQEKHYDLQKLPPKYYGLYGYAKQVIGALKEKKKVVSKLENKDGVFTLLKNNSFEAVFKNGYKVNLKGNDNTVRLKTPDGNTLEISASSEESLNYSLEAKAIATKALKYYNALASEKPDMLGTV